MRLHVSPLHPPDPRLARFLSFGLVVRNGERSGRSGPVLRVWRAVPQATRHTHTTRLSIRAWHGLWEHHAEQQRRCRTLTHTAASQLRRNCVRAWAGVRAWSEAVAEVRAARRGESTPSCLLTGNPVVPFHCPRSTTAPACSQPSAGCRV
jgi:hypothetical protein